MSKNVAVFVDVANIFYAAKAAGADIDYVTLLRSAVAGRDFVRAYAYTGLDPENENQRQFHSFLGRNGYRVVSKDIRKYGDGRIKANLDIELVVDMMKTARNLDVAVVVSGDGDFAPAIRAVQEMGVRVEVISFRGNTSSDLIDVADVFMDITQIARVDKGSRSGRRVAAEGDLSMTEVPEKETEGLGIRRRRSRGRGGERDERPAAAHVTRMERPRPEVLESEEDRALEAPSNVIVLPGEKLSRFRGVPDDEDLPARYEDSGERGEALEPVRIPAAEIVAGDGADDEITEGATTEGDGRRRRRRRGGRGRGRGRGVDGAVPALGMTEGAAEDVVDEEEAPEAEAPRIPQHSTFGSVWDTQLGVASGPYVASGGTDEEDLGDEPEVPEYLLAERRQRAQRGRGAPGAGRMGPRGGARAGYQSAVDRERYGRGGSPAGAGGFQAPRRDDRPRGGQPPRPLPARSPRSDRDPVRESRENRDHREREAREGRVRSASASAPLSAEPWSEVPPELEELLRAELARKGSASDRFQAPPVEEPADGAAPPQNAVPTDTDAESAPEAAGAGRSSAAATAATAATTTSSRARTGRGRTVAAPEAVPDADTQAVAIGASDATYDGDTEGAGPKRRAPRRRSAASEAAAEPAQPDAAGPAPRRRARRSTPPSEVPSDTAVPAAADGGARDEAPAIAADEDGAAATTPTPRRTTRARRTAAAGDPAEVSPPTAPAEASKGEPALTPPAVEGSGATSPARRARRRVAAPASDG